MKYCKLKKKHMYVGYGMDFYKNIIGLSLYFY